MMKYRKQASLFVPVLLVSGLTLLSAPALAGPGKVTICHKSDEVKYHRITVSSRALPAHLRHGDCVVDDGVFCTVDSCDGEVGCIHAPDDSLCDDGDACTIDTCDPSPVSTGCVYTPVNCDDGDACTTDSCDPASGCVYTPISCDDGNACTVDTCDPATGCVYTPISCDDNNACTTDTCNPATGCVYTPVAGCCRDNNDCTPPEICRNGTCTSCGDGVVSGDEICDPPGEVACSPDDGGCTVVVCEEGCETVRIRSCLDGSCAECAAGLGVTCP